MIKLFSYILYIIIIKINDLIFLITKRNFRYYLYDYLRDSSISTLFISNKKISFFTPSSISKWRIDNFFEKEPETLEWIDDFEDSNSIFWDIGANIGVYSIYAAVKKSKLRVFSFEPSTSNLNLLSRNISMNQLHERITISQIPLTVSDNQFLMMKESSLIEGSALNAFGVDFDSNGENIQEINKYKIFGNSINDFLDSGTLEIPDYIKIDVDGIEHLILSGADKYLNNKKIKSILVELNEDFKDQFKSSLEILNNNGFSLEKKERSKMVERDHLNSKTYNFIFKRD